MSEMDFKIRISAEDRANATLKAASAAIKQVEEAQRAANQASKDWQALGARSGQAIAADMEKVKAALASIKASGNASFAEIARATEAAKGKLKGFDNELRGVERAGQGIVGVFRNVAGAFTAMLGGLALGNVVQAAESFATLRVKLEQSEGSIQGAGIALERLSVIAKSAGAPIVELGQSYERYSRAIAAMGGSQEDALNFTEALAGALKLSGATAQEAASTMLQLSQAMQSGKLNGEEFAAVNSNGGRVLDYLAKELGRSRGELLEMAKAGEITGQEMLKLGNANKKIAEEAAKMPLTLSAAWTNFNSDLAKTLGSSEAFRATMSLLGDTIMLVANNVDKLLAALAGAATAWAIGWAAANVSLAGIATGLATVKTGIAAATVSLGALKAALTGLLATPWGLFIGAITAVIGLVAYDWIAAWAGADAAQSNALDNLKAKLKEAETNLADLDAKIGQSKEKLSTLFEELAKEYDAALKLDNEATNGQLNAIRERYDRERALLQALVSDKDSLRRDEIKLIQQVVDQEYEILRAAGERNLARIREEYTLKMRLAQAASNTPQTRAKLEAEAQEQLLARLKEIWTEEAAAYGQHLSDLENQALASTKRLLAIDQERADGIKAIQDAIKAANLDTLHATARAEEERKQNVKEIGRLEAEVAKGNKDAVIELIKLYQQQYELEKKAAGNENIQLNANERTMEQVRLIERLTALQDKFAQGKSDQAQTENQINVAINAQLETMNELVGKAKENVQSVREIMAEGAFVTIGVKADEFKAQVNDLVKWVNEREDAKLQVQLIGDDIAELAKAAEQAAKAAEVKIPLEPEINPGLLRDGLDKAIAQTTPPAIPVVVDTKPVEQELSNLDRLTKAREITIQAKANTEEAINDIQALKSENTSSNHTITTNYRKALAEIMSLNGRNTSSTHTIRVRRVEDKATGGPVGLAAGGFPRRRGYITGPGTETSDSIPAMLSRGEFVLRAAAVKQWGLGFLQALNRGFLPALPRLAAGGLVAPAVATSAGLPEMAINLSIQGGSPMRVLSSRDTARNLAQALRNLERGR